MTEVPTKTKTTILDLATAGYSDPAPACAPETEVKPAIITEAAAATVSSPAAKPLADASEARQVDAFFSKVFELVKPKGALHDHDKTNDVAALKALAEEGKALHLDTDKLVAFVAANEGKFVTTNSTSNVTRELAGELYNNRKAVKAGTLTKENAQDMLNAVTANLRAANTDQAKAYNPQYVQDAKYFADQIEARLAKK